DVDEVVAMGKGAGDVAEAARRLSIDAPAQPFNGQQNSHPEAFPTCWHHKPFPPAKAIKPVSLFLFRVNADHGLRTRGKEERTMPDEPTFELVSVHFGAEPVAVFRFGYEQFELRARLGPGNLEHAIAAAAEVAASVFAKWSHEALAFAQRVRAGEDGGSALH